MIAGVRTKHSSEIFKSDKAYNHEHEGLILARLIGSTIYILFSANDVPFQNNDVRAICSSLFIS